MSLAMGRGRSVRVFGALFVAFAMVLLSTAEPALARTTANKAGPPTLTHAVQPTFSPGAINRCPKGTTTFINTSKLRPGDQSVSYSNSGTTFQATVNLTGTSLSFTTNSPSFTVYVVGQGQRDHNEGSRHGQRKGWGSQGWGRHKVKRGPGYDTYNYTGTTTNPAYPSDTGLHAPYDGQGKNGYGKNSYGKLAKIGHYLVCGQPSTEKASPSLTTAPGAGGTVGTAVLNDTGTLSGGASPGGSITFNLYNPSQTGCTGTPVYTQTVTVSGDGSYSTTNTSPANMAGTWNWTAMYSGDSNNLGSSSACGQETVSVAEASPTLTTAPSSGGAVGSAVLNDTGTLSGGYEPSGSITFNLYNPSQTGCTGTPAYTQTVTVSGDGSYSTANTATATTAGTWSWTATYTGDSNNLGASSACAQETVSVTSSSLPQGSCEGSGSISTLVSGTNVVSYVPKGAWDSERDRDRRRQRGGHQHH